MQAYRLKKRVSETGDILLSGLPFNEGEVVDVIVLSREKPEKARNGSSLRGSVKKYMDPTEPVAVDDWKAAR